MTHAFFTTPSLSVYLCVCNDLYSRMKYAVFNIQPTQKRFWDVKCLLLMCLFTRCEWSFCHRVRWSFSFSDDQVLQTLFFPLREQSDQSQPIAFHSLNPDYLFIVYKIAAQHFDARWNARSRRPFLRQQQSTITVAMTSGRNKAK